MADHQSLFFWSVFELCLAMDKQALFVVVKGAKKASAEVAIHKAYQRLICLSLSPTWTCPHSLLSLVRAYIKIHWHHRGFHSSVDPIAVTSKFVNINNVKDDEMVKVVRTSAPLSHQVTDLYPRP